MASPFDQAFSPGFLDNAPVAPAPVPNVLQQLPASRAPAAVVPRMSAVDAWNKIGNALMMMSGPTSRQMVYDQQNQEMNQQLNQQKLLAGQAELNDAALQKMMIATPALEDAFNQGGAPAVQAAWEQLVPVLGIAPEKAAQFGQMLAANPVATVRQMKAMLPKEKTGSLPASIQEAEYLRRIAADPEAMAKMPPLVRQRIEAMANPNAIKPDQAADNALAAARFNYQRSNDAANRALKARALQIAAERAAAAGRGKGGAADPAKVAEGAAPVVASLKDAIQRLYKTGGMTDEKSGIVGTANATLRETVPGYERFTNPEGFSARQDLDRLLTVGIPALLPLMGGLTLGGKNIDAAKELDTWRKAIASSKDYPSAMRAVAGFEQRLKQMTAEAAAPASPNRPKITPRAGPTPVRNDAEYARLPSGTVFVGPDGRTRRKP